MQYILIANEKNLMSKLVPKKDRILETINASKDDANKLLKVMLIYNLTMHFNKKMFGKEKDFCKEAHEVHQKTINSIKCEYAFTMKGNLHDGALYTIDHVEVPLNNILRSLGESFSGAGDVFADVQKLCYKHDKGRQFVIIPVLGKIYETYWSPNFL